MKRGLSLGLTLLLVTVAFAQSAPVEDQLAARLAKVRKHLPDITRVAEAVAQRWVERKQVLIHVPFGGDGGTFAMEHISRAGGLDNAQPNTVRIKERSANDVATYGARCWGEKATKFIGTDAAKQHGAGWMIIVFGSKAGMPKEIPVDFLIDNFAKGPGEDEAAVNHMVNISNGWVFFCELTGALTRLGQRPGILLGMPIPGATANNKQFQIGTPTLYPIETKIPRGKLGTAYLNALEQTLADLRTPEQRKQIERAAEIAAAKIKAGKTVWMSSFTHTLDGEVFENNRSPVKAFRGISCGPNGEAFTKNLKEGDLLFWFGEWTQNMPWRDYLKIIRSTHTDYIPCFRRNTEKLEPMEHDDVFYDFKVDDAVMVLEQHWPFENAVVDIPFPPVKMAPVSGVYVSLMYRMLDEAIARQLAQQIQP